MKYVNKQIKIIISPKYYNSFKVKWLNNLVANSSKKNIFQVHILKTYF